MKTMRAINSVICLFLAITISISSCKKDDDDSANPIPPTGATLKTSVVGKITDTDGSVMPGVTVKLGSITTITDTRGHFLFKNAEVPTSRLLITASKTGYFKCIHAKKTQASGTNYVNLVLEEQPVPVTISATTGGVINIPGGARITFPANAFADQNGVAYTGQVKVIARHINPGADNFETLIPGGDLSGINSLGQTRTLYSLGMIEALLYDNTGVNEIKLATGQTAELRFPIDPSQTASAQLTAPMWYLNETTGIWKEEGEAIKSGNFFTGSVSHFSTWNCDYSGERTDITGKVVDCQNIPIPNIVVSINGFLTITTDNNGMFTTWVPVGYVINCQVLSLHNPSLSINSNLETITAAGGQVNIVPTLTIACVSRISGYIKACNGVTPSTGFLYISWNGGNRFMYCEDGTYNIEVPQNTTIKIIASESNLMDEESITTGNQATTTIVPSLILCNAINFEGTKFTLNKNGISTDYVMFVASTTSNYTDQNGDGTFESAIFNFFGYVLPGNINTSINIGLFGETNGYYSLLQNSLNNIYIDMDSTGTFANGNFATTTLNRLTVTDYGSAGSMLTGEFEFDHSSGTITNGQFSIQR